MEALRMSHVKRWPYQTAYKRQLDHCRVPWRTVASTLGTLGASLKSSMSGNFQAKLVVKPGGERLPWMLRRRHVKPPSCSLVQVSEEPEAQEESTAQKSIGQRLCDMMPSIVVAAAVIALVYPPSFMWFQKQDYPTALGCIMLSIGVQLSLSDFSTVVEQPQDVALGLLLQYIVKPILCLFTVSLFEVPSQFSAGLTLTGCVSGAQLASYATSLAKGSIALSVVLTSISTIAAVVITPLLSKLLIGAVIPVDAVAMGKSILQVVILPVALGLLLNARAKPLVDRARPYLPVPAVICTVLCIGSPLAFNRQMLISGAGLALIAPVLFFHVACATAGYWVTKVPGLRQDEIISRTLALNGAMQSSALAMLLASQFLGGSNAVPASCSVVIMSLVGLSLGSFWGEGKRISSVGDDLKTVMKEMMYEWQLEGMASWSDGRGFRYTEYGSDQLGQEDLFYLL